MSVEENKAIVRRLVEEGWPNPDTLGQYVADDFVAGNASGLDAYKQGVSAVLAGFPDIRFILKDIIAEGDKVVVRCEFKGTHTGDLYGIPPTNREASYGGTYTFRLADGKVVEQWWHWNAFGLYTQLGVIPPWEEFVQQANAKLR